jgi:hypothetical protein
LGGTSEGIVMAAYESDYARLAQIKKKYDPLMCRGSTRTSNWRIWLEPIAFVDLCEPDGVRFIFEERLMVLPVYDDLPRLYVIGQSRIGFDLGLPFITPDVLQHADSLKGRTYDPSLPESILLTDDSRGLLHG